MTIEKFMSNYGIRNKKKVELWIREGLIPKANISENYVPDSARPPYTNARAKNANSIYVSIVKASAKKKHVLPKLYKICDDEFNSYIDILVKANLIVRRVSDDVTYYDATLHSNDVKRSFILEAINRISSGVSEGITSAFINNTAS